MFRLLDELFYRRRRLHDLMRREIIDLQMSQSVLQSKVNRLERELRDGKMSKGRARVGVAK